MKSNENMIKARCLEKGWQLRSERKFNWKREEKKEGF